MAGTMEDLQHPVADLMDFSIRNTMRRTQGLGESPETFPYIPHQLRDIIGNSCLFKEIAIRALLSLFIFCR